MNVFNVDAGMQSLFWQIFRLHYLRNHSILEEIGLYPGQPPLLMILDHCGTLSQKELSDRLCVKPATVAVMIKRMEKAGLVCKKADTEDKRVTRVILADAGKQKVEAIKEKYRQLELECSEGLTMDEKVILRRLLLQIKENLLKHVDAPKYEFEIHRADVEEE